MTEVEKWLVANGIRQCPLMGGYSPYGRPFTELPMDEVVAIARNDYRAQAINGFGFALLTREVVDFLLPHGPFLEVGAGRGYWSWELERAGADVVTTDSGDFRELRNWQKLGEGEPRVWKEPELLPAAEAVRKYQGRTLLMVWPSLGDPWAAEAAEEFGRQGGRKLVYVGEGEGGCTADRRFFGLLEEGWEEAGCCPLPQWEGIHDALTVYERK